MKTATKEKPILFSGPMVRAIFDGSKTQTRRPIKGLPTALKYFRPLTHVSSGVRGVVFLDTPNLEHTSTAYTRYFPYQPGDVLWVKEKHVILDQDGWIDPSRPRDELFSTHPYPRCNGVGYSDFENDPESERCRQEQGYRWRPSIHMPRWAARLFLEVTDVRVQRIQDISDEDCHAEGLDEDQLDGGSHCVDGMKSWHVWMMDLWERQYPGSWQRNDWCWCYTFKRGK